MIEVDVVKAEFVVTKGVKGNVSFIDESSADGYTFLSADIIGDIGGYLEMIDKSSGRAFYSADIAIGDVEGEYALFEDSSPVHPVICHFIM